MSPGCRLFANLTPQHQPRPCKRYRLVENGGRWYTENRDRTTTFSASGRYIYVVTRFGDVMVARRDFGHIDLAGGAEVLYAGEIRFSHRRKRGTLIWWSNGSGHYQPGPEWNHQAGLPLDLFRAYEED